MTTTDENDYEGLAKTMAKVQDHHQKAAESIAEGDVRNANYHLGQAYFALEDYLVDGTANTEESDR